MSKVVVVLGATGAQGGGVARALLKSGRWQVRAVTRNKTSEAAQKLASEGAEVVTADANDVASLEAAFKDAYGVFGLTNYWEHLFTGSDQAGAGEKEAVQAWNIALAASKSASLEHYFWSTLPNASAITGGKHKCAHFDFKAEVDERIRKELPKLYEKTTFVWLAWYPTNMAYMAPIKMFEIPGLNKYVWLQGSPPDSYLPASGNVSHNTGRFVLGALDNPSKSRGRYIDVKTDTPTLAEIVKIWSEVTGKEGTYLHLSRESLQGLWGIAGLEMDDQYAFGTACKDWEKGSGKDFATWEDLGIKRSELIDLKQDLEGVKAQLV